MPADAPVRRKDVRHRTTFGNRFRFLVRFLGLTGIVAAAAGWAAAADALPDVPAGWTAEAARPAVDKLVALAEGSQGLTARVGTVALAAGVVAVLVWGLVELLGGLFLVTGRKTAVGTNAVVQTALAVALLVIVNVISFGNYKRFDLTRAKEFTLAPELVTDLQKLRADSPTTIVVLLRHQTGLLSDRADPEERAAERKVVEKVEDVVGQLRELGPRFNVVVLDVDAKGYKPLLREVTLRRPGLADAIAAAPDNSIFFYADGKVRRVPRADADRAAGSASRPAVAPDPDDGSQSLVYPTAVTRLSFTEFYQLDKTASVEATPAEREGLAAVGGAAAFAPGVQGKGNLVLVPRGKESFVRRVLALEERRPRVGFLVVHPYLTSRAPYEEYTAAGMRRALEDHGFEVVDVVLKKWPQRGTPTPVAYTYEESDLDAVENRVKALSSDAGRLERTAAALAAAEKAAGKALAAAADAKTVDERRAFLLQAVQALQPVIGGRIATESQLRQVVAELPRLGEELRGLQADTARELAELEPRYRALAADDRASENRRRTDLKGKFKQYVTDCDALIVARSTVIELTQQHTIPPSLHNVDKAQGEVIKEYLKDGKPVLFAVGPTNVPDRAGFGEETGPDEVERIIARLGIELGRQTVVTNVEGQAMAEKRSEPLGSSVELPPLVFDPPTKDGVKPNPVADALRLTARAADRALDVRKSGYRPVYVSPALADKMPFAGELAYTVRESWNEEKPVGDEDAVPKFEPAKPNDPRRGTRDEERRGPFPVGVAVETPVPADWFDPPANKDADGPPAGLAPYYPVAALALGFDHGLSAAGMSLAADRVKRPTVRVVVLGHGGLFTGKQLPAAQETLLLHCLNWGLKRGDRLPVDVPDADKWRYPRADLSPPAYRAWRWGTLLGLPLLVAYVGLIALMARKVR